MFEKCPGKKVLANVPSVPREQVRGHLSTRKCISACRVPLLSSGLQQLSRLLEESYFPPDHPVCMGSLATF